MSLPGFTAETSLYRSSYDQHAAVKDGTRAGVAPQGTWCQNKCASFWFNCHETCRQVGFSWVCIDRCLGMTAACEAGCDMLRI